MEKPTAELTEFYQTLIDSYPIEPKQMFGMPCGFINGNMQSGLFAQYMFLRLSDEDRAEFIKETGSGLFDPGNGRPMKEYVEVPEEVRTDDPVLSGWMQRSVAYVLALPAKEKKRK